MKKFLALLLVAVITCDTVEQNLLVFLTIIRNGVDIAINWLKEKGLWDFLVGTLKIHGKAVASTFCERVFDADICNGIIDNIEKILNK